MTRRRELAPLRVQPAPEELQDEDILEMVSAGPVPMTVVDSHKAEFWAQVVPDLALHRDVAVREDRRALRSPSGSARSGTPRAPERARAPVSPA